MVTQEEIFVARAPGRLDVLGGIADYSGSLVLQVSIYFSASPCGLAQSFSCMTLHDCYGFSLFTSNFA